MKKYKVMIRKPSGQKKEIKFVAQDEKTAKEIALQIKAGERRWG